MQIWLRVIISLFIPIAWGLGSAWLLDILGRSWRKRKSATRQTEPPQ